MQHHFLFLHCLHYYAQWRKSSRELCDIIHLFSRIFLLLCIFIHNEPFPLTLCLPLFTNLCKTNNNTFFISIWCFARNAVNTSIKQSCLCSFPAYYPFKAFLSKYYRKITRTQKSLTLNVKQKLNMDVYQILL